MSHTPAQKLEALNTYRAAEGLSAYKDWRPARHQSQLDTYRAAQDARIDAREDAEQAAADAEYAARKQAADDEKARREAEEAALIEAANKPVKAPRKAKEKAPAKDSSLGQIANKADFADHTELQTAAEDKAKGTSYKQMPRHDKSLVEKPVGFVHQFLSDNPRMTRKAAILALVDGYGINYSTARTQYQRWFQGRNKA